MIAKELIFLRKISHIPISYPQSIRIVVSNDLGREVWHEDQHLSPGTQEIDSMVVHCRKGYTFTKFEWATKSKLGRW